MQRFVFFFRETLLFRGCSSECTVLVHTDRYTLSHTHTRTRKQACFFYYQLLVVEVHRTVNITHPRKNSHKKKNTLRPAAGSRSTQNSQDIGTLRPRTNSGNFFNFVFQTNMFYLFTQSPAASRTHTHTDTHKHTLTQTHTRTHTDRRCSGRDRW